MSKAAVPPKWSPFLKQLLPGKHIAELYTLFVFYKAGKSENSIRAPDAHRRRSEDRFNHGTCVRGMV